MKGYAANPPLRWLFLDMNSYFASVEQNDRPELRGQPVGVIPVDSEHTCCIAASAEAKRRGVKTGTRVREARAMCPGIELVLARPRHYVQVHHRLRESIEKHLPVEATESIDEFALELLGSERDPEAATQIGRSIQRQVLDDLGPCLTCSVGVAPTRLLAKIASEVQKPSGLVLLTPADLPGRLAHFELRDLTGIGAGMVTRLRRHGVDTVQQLWDLPRDRARHIWGSVQGLHWWDEFHGVAVPRPVTHRHSMGHGHILPTKFRHADGALTILTRLLHKATARLREHGYVARRLHASVGFAEGDGWGDDIALPAIQDTLTAMRHLRRLWDRPRRTHGFRGHTPKKVQVTLSELCDIGSATGHLFPQADHPLRLAEAMDRINRRHGTHTVYLGGMHACRNYRMDDKIAFGRVPDETVRM